MQVARKRMLLRQVDKNVPIGCNVGTTHVQISNLPQLIRQLSFTHVSVLQRPLAAHTLQSLLLSRHGTPVSDINKFLFIDEMGNLHYRPNFISGKINKIFYQSSKEHLKISRIAKFDGEML